MNQTNKKAQKWSIERKILATLSLTFIGVLIAAWISAITLKQSLSVNAAVMNVDVRALIEIEKMRNILESEISNGRSFFLLGSSNLLSEAKRERQNLKDALASFERQFNLPQIPEIGKRVLAIEQEHQEIFDEGMKFREKHTDAKIVGQFYQSKVGKIRSRINSAFDDMIQVQNTELDKARARAKEASVGAETQIPRSMTLFSVLFAVLFVGMALLIVRMLQTRGHQVAERDRLYEEAKKALLNRDEILSAVSRDLNEPLNSIAETAEKLQKLEISPAVHDELESIKTAVVTSNDLINNILDQAKSEMGSLTLRLEQLGIDNVLDEAHLMLLPFAKQRDIRLQFDNVNPPVLAFLDRERVMRVLGNLVGNAIKFSPSHSKVTVKVRSDQQFVHVSVTDSGPGIPENQLPGIFDHFWQAKKTADQGAGVGLGVVKTVVEAHGGTVRVDSNVGYGSTFTFTLPRRRPVGVYVKRPMPIVRHIARSTPPSLDPLPGVDA